MKMKIICVVTLIMWLFFGFLIRTDCSVSPVMVEFFWRDPCTHCPSWQEEYERYLQRNQTLNNIEASYKEKVRIIRIECYSEEGQIKWGQYKDKYNNDITEFWYSIVINYEVVIKGRQKIEDLEYFLTEIIDKFLALPQSNSPEIQLTLAPEDTIAYVGDLFKINVFLENVGDFTRPFNLTIYCGDYVVNKTCIYDLKPKTERKITIYLDTRNIPEGSYLISAYINFGSEETVRGIGGVIEIKSAEQIRDLATLLFLHFPLVFLRVFLHV